MATRNSGLQVLARFSIKGYTPGIFDERIMLLIVGVPLFRIVFWILDVDCWLVVRICSLKCIWDWCLDIARCFGWLAAFV